MKEAKEIEVVTLMIQLYCRKKHKSAKGELCPECKELIDYVRFRRSKCPFGDKKPFCTNCKIHCYKSDMRERIKAVMRFAGPRMIFSHPVIAMRHLLETKRQKKAIAAAAKTAAKKAKSQNSENISEETENV